MSIVIFGDSFFYPEGDASTNRVHTYAKGLTENGMSVHVICFASEYDSPGDGTLTGINYYHPFGQKKRSKHLVIRRWNKFIKYFKTITLFRKINKKDKIDTIIVYSMQLPTHLFAWLLSRIVNSKLIKESSGHPLLHYRKSVFNKGLGLIKLEIESNLCDGIFCISQFLVGFYREHRIPQRKLFLLPSTVDPSRFSPTGEKPHPYPYIGYFGGLTFKRKKKKILVKAFAIVSNKHPDIHLIVGGFCSEHEKRKIEDLILDLKLLSKVVLLKYLSRSEIVKYITHSDILVMVRAKDLETMASFPSKLTEYLATSKPVITVNVGEIPDYLTDGFNSFMVEAGNCNQLAEKLDYVLNNYELALEVAERGKQLTSNVFNYNFQAKRIIQYIETL